MQTHAAGQLHVSFGLPGCHGGLMARPGMVLAWLHARRHDAVPTSKVNSEGGRPWGDGHVQQGPLCGEQQWLLCGAV
jgi:hypothetical protein